MAAIGIKNIIVEWVPVGKIQVQGIDSMQGMYCGIK